MNNSEKSSNIVPLVKDAGRAMGVFTKVSSFIANWEMAWEIQGGKGEDIKPRLVQFFSEYIYDHKLHLLSGFIFLMPSKFFS